MSRREAQALEGEVARLAALGLFMLAGMIALAVSLWNIQVARGDDFRRDLMRQSVRRVRIPAARGRIYDRHGVVLADNRPSFALAIYLESLRARPGSRGKSTMDLVRETMEEIQAWIGLPPELTESDIRAHLRRRLPLPLIAWRDIPETAVARWAEHAQHLPGVDLLIEPVRHYPARETLCHTLGYVGGLRETPRAEDPDESYHYRLPEYEGRAGLEKQYESLLRGEAGGRLVPVDVAGFRRRDLERDAPGGPTPSVWGMGRGGGDGLRRAIQAEYREPRPGRDLRLAIDIRIQHLAEEALEGHIGAAVVLDPRNGDVLALASRPAYDPNAFVPAIPSALWRSLMEDPAIPLIHRATTAAYAPGSTFKPVTAVAASRHGLTPATTYECDGSISLGRQPFRCWDTLGHGRLDLRRAICVSCNVYFYQAALAAGPEALADAAREFGLGARTGIDLAPESAGLAPDPAWKRATHRESWTPGNTAHYAIGQSYLLATPVQMAVLAAAIANGGTVYRPRLMIGDRPFDGGAFSERPPEVVRRVSWPPRIRDAIRGGMEDVVMSEQGTGKRARVPGMRIAGKTGTAEFGPADRKKKRGWMIAYAPADQPRYAVAMMVEDAVSGGLTVAPLVQRLMRGLAEGAPDGRPALPEEARP